MTRPNRLTRCVTACAAAAALLWTPHVPAAEEVPFVTTPDNVTLELLRLAGVGPGDYVIDLGSGDGRIVIVAAQRFGARGLGVEIVPDLVMRSLASAHIAGVAERTEFRVQDLFQTDLSRASVVTLYLLPEVNLQLRPALLALTPGTRIISHDWDMGDWRPDETRVVDAPDKKVGLAKVSSLHRWVVPAQVDGLWCAAAPAQGTRLRVRQTFQHVRGTLEREGTTQSLVGRVDGMRVSLLQPSGSHLDLRLDQDELRVTYASGFVGEPRPALFARAVGSECPATVR